MSQHALFHESIADAIRAVVQATGGMKAVGRLLWPEKSADAASKLLVDCLNDTRPERLNPEQVMFLARLGRERGCHAVMLYLARECGYSDPTPIEPEDEKAALQRQYIEAVKTMADIMRRV